MEQLWVTEVMDVLQAQWPTMSDEHAHDLADDLQATCVRIHHAWR